MCRTGAKPSTRFLCSTRSQDQPKPAYPLMWSADCARLRRNGCLALADSASPGDSLDLTFDGLLHSTAGTDGDNDQRPGDAVARLPLAIARYQRGPHDPAGDTTKLERT